MKVNKCQIVFFGDLNKCQIKVNLNQVKDNKNNNKNIY